MADEAAKTTELEALVYKLVGDGKSFEKMLKDAEDATKKTTNTVTEELNKVTGAVGGFGSQIGKVADSLGVGTGFNRLLGDLGKGWGAASDKAEEARTSIAGLWEQLVGGGSIVGDTVEKFNDVTKALTSMSAASIASSFSTAWTTALAKVNVALVTTGSMATTVGTALKGLSLAGWGKVGLVVAGVGAALYGTYKAVEAYTERNDAMKEKIKELRKAHEEQLATLEQEREEYVNAGTEMINYAQRVEHADKLLGKATGGVAKIRKEIDALQEEIAKAGEVRFGNKWENTFGISVEQQNRAEKMRLLMEKLEGAQADLSDREDGEGVTVRLEKQKEAVQQLEDEYKKLGGNVTGVWNQLGFAMGELFKRMTGGESAGGRDRMLEVAERLKQAKAEMEALAQTEKELKGLKEVDPKVTKSIEDLTRSLKLQAITWGKTGEAAKIALAEYMGVDEGIIEEANKELDNINNLRDIDAVMRQYQGLVDSLERSTKTWGMSADEIKLWELQMLQTKKGVGLTIEEMEKLQSLMKTRANQRQADEQRKEWEILGNDADRLVERFMDPVLKMQREIDNLNFLESAFELPPDVYQKALDEIIAKYNGMEDAAKRAEKAIRGIDAALVGSAEANARLLAYRETLQFTPKTAAFAQGQPQHGQVVGQPIPVVGPEIHGPVITQEDRQRREREVEAANANPFALINALAAARPNGQIDKPLIDLVAINKAMQAILASINRGIANLGGKRTIEIGEAAFEERP